MKKLLAFAATLALISIASCSSSTNSSDAVNSGGMGNGVNFRVNLTDAPMMSMQAVNVTISAVRVHESADAASDAAGWREIPVTAPMPVDMLRIQGVLYELCTATLPAGRYQQVRLVVRQNDGATPPYHNSAMTMDGVVHPVAMPAEMKIVHSFVVADATTTDLTLDLQVQQSMHQRGNGEYFMTPVIGASSMMK
jgi:hypothetical protein